ncbi:hypothetical protein [Aliiroseovarius sp. YM-037]|uniref:hypothetical protein n=1 Tax=Aliiroseovarius sp. YM-037 TaxID=3341728 RepID=UPI003A7FC36C
MGKTCEGDCIGVQSRYISPMTETCDPPADLTDRIRTHLATDPGRVSRLEVNERTLWIKQRETLDLRRRLQKGDPSKGFERERAALHHLATIDAPVPPIVAEGADFFALPDCGQPLSQILQQGVGTDAERIQIFRAAGEALSGLHKRGVSHGRPNLKDICWQDGEITFIDLERYSGSRNTPKGHMQDLIMFVFNAHAVAGKPSAEVDAAIDAYRATDTAGIWAAAKAWCRRMRWVEVITKPVRWLRSSAEFDAIPMVFRTFGA